MFVPNLLDMIDLEQFRTNAEKEGICQKYALLWDKAGSKKQLMDIAMCSQGADFLCDAIAKGWGISSDEIAKKFARYINGVYTHEALSGYTSVLYCKYYGAIEADDTLIILIDCDVTVSVPDWAVCSIYATGMTNISIIGGGRVNLVAYGDIEKVTVESVSKECRFKRTQKKERDKE